MTISEITAARQQQAEELVSLIEETASKYKALAGTTGALGEALCVHVQDRRLRDHGRRPAVTMEVIQGMSSLPERMRILIEYAFFGIGDGRGLDLLGCITGENAAANREVSNG